MDNFLAETLISPGWWFTAIFIGIVISIIGNKLTDPVSNWLGRFILSIRLRNDDKRAKFDTKVQYLLLHPHEELILRIERNYRETTNSVFVVGALTTIVSVFGISVIVFLASQNTGWSWGKQINIGPLAVSQLSILVSILATFVALSAILFLLGTSKAYDATTLAQLIKEIDRIREEDNVASDNQSTKDKSQ